MLFVKFYTSVFMLHSICCKYPLTWLCYCCTYSPCAILYVSTCLNLIQKQTRFTTTNGLICETGCFIFHLKYPYNRGICLALDFVMPLSLLVSSSSAYFYSAPFFLSVTLAASRYGHASSRVNPLSYNAVAYGIPTYL